MKKTMLIVVVVVLIVVLTGGYLAVTYLNQGDNNDKTPEQKVLSVTEIRDGAILFVAANHTGTLPLMNDLSWSGGVQETGIVGAETYVYTSGIWSIVIDYAVVENPVYTIVIDYSDDDATINWLGTYGNTGFAETSATIEGVDPNLTTEQIRDLTMMYLKLDHAELAQYMDDLSWTGGAVEMNGIVGYEEYNYQSNGWNVTIGNPVVPNPPYTIEVVYTPSTMLTWEGTLENGVITEVSCVFNPTE
ncbi:MAG: hypothetical protein GX799_04780 [Crenarchaeota archaeon]|nr:hypothetical protein [Thermoproteota archaeon]